MATVHAPGETVQEEHLAPRHVEDEPEHPVMGVPMMGMYIFLSSEVMFFGSLFSVYFYLFGSHPLGWPPVGTQPVHWFPIPFFNTFILIMSGVTCHFATEGLSRGNRRQWYLLIVSTLILGAFFELGQGFEFATARLSLGHTTNQFGSAFFIMTGFHGAHVFGGLLFIALMVGRSLRGHFTPEKHVGPAAATLYWHFVDVVWIFLFGILYLAVTA
ncbi:MAG: heme-copper oxidase subunit III [Candidatus Dormibacteraeota bacterium]|nr:heme-copper oxidase subunit III [Candidatus Dormibacteraeota bacterium]